VFDNFLEVTFLCVAADFWNFCLALLSQKFDQLAEVREKKIDVWLVGVGMNDLVAVESCNQAWKQKLNSVLNSNSFCFVYIVT